MLSTFSKFYIEKNHHSGHPNNRQCDYLIAQPPGTKIRLDFTDFDIEGSYNCAFDYLEIRDGDSQNSTLIGKFCGDPSLTPDPVSSTMNYIWMRFVTGKFLKLCIYFLIFL